jgi:hypothetical protein
MKFAGGWRPAETARMTQALGFGEIGFTEAQPIFSLLAFLDVSASSGPLPSFDIDRSPTRSADYASVSKQPDK